MGIEPGTYDLGPQQAALLVHTAPEGRAAAMGHALTIELTKWSAVLTARAEFSASSLVVDVQLDALEIVQSTGGAAPLGSSGRREVLKNAAKSLDVRRFPTAEFVSTAMSGTWDEGTVEGVLTMHGTEVPLTLVVDSPEADTYRIRGTLLQSSAGVTPFSTMLGALRLRDAVELEASVSFA